MSTISHLPSEIGYVYLLDNHRVPNIVKIGYTNRTPQERAAELKGTATPGAWVVRHHWKIPNAYFWEQRIHGELSAFRLEREFFELTVSDAKKFIHDYLLKHKIIGDDGLTPTEREFENLRLRKLAEEAAEKEKKEKNDRLKVDWEGYKSSQWKASWFEAKRHLEEMGYAPNKAAPIEPVIPKQPEVYSLKGLKDNFFLVYGSLSSIVIGVLFNNSFGLFVAVFGVGILLLLRNELKIPDPAKVEAYKKAKAVFDQEKLLFDEELSEYNAELKEMSEDIYWQRYQSFFLQNGVVIPVDEDVITIDIN